jgi:hypothetical protein
MCKAGTVLYYGITGNGRALSVFEDRVTWHWQYWLRRRSQRRRLSWPRFLRLLKRYALPPPKVVHSVYRRAVNPCL